MDKILHEGAQIGLYFSPQFHRYMEEFEGATLVQHRGWPKQGSGVYHLHPHGVTLVYDELGFSGSAYKVKTCKVTLHGEKELVSQIERIIQIEARGQQMTQIQESREITPDTLSLP